MYTETKKEEPANSAYAAKDELNQAANKAGRKVRGFIEAASEDISHASETVTKEIRTNPVQSTLIALGAGFLLGALLTR